ncbi:MAG: hypothetical protein P8Y60_06185, partial [Calditrichota bacterium]
FKDLWSNDDERKYKLARQVLDGQFRWLEEGSVGLKEEQLLERTPVKKMNEPHNGRVREALEMIEDDR